MRRLLGAVMAVAVGVGALLVAPGAAGAAVREEVAGAAPTIQLISATSGAPGRGGDGESTQVDITPDGRYQVFASTSTNLVAAPTATGATQIYLRDSTTGSVRMISTSADGTRAGDIASTTPSISDDGSVVAFLSGASNLAPTGAPFARSVFVWHRDSNSIIDATTALMPDGAITDVELSGNGRTIAFVTAATNLAGIPTYNRSQVYRLRLGAGTAEIISVSDTGTASASGGSEPSISRDGSSVAFTATELEVGGKLSQRPQVFLFAGSHVYSVSGFGNGWSTSPSISAESGVVAFVSTSTDISPRPVNGQRRVYLRDMRNTSPTLVALTPHRRTPGDGESYAPVLSADGYFVAFVSTATQLVAGTDGTPQVYMGDIQSNGLRLVSRSASGALADHEPAGLAVDDDASVVLFEASAKNLVPGVTGRQVYSSRTHVAPTLERIGGADRYEVSARISATTFPPSVPVAYLASGEGYADALSGGAMAGAQSGPVLLTRKASIPDPVLAELARLKPRRIVVLGGVATIDEAVIMRLAGLAPKVERAAGADRYATSVEVSKSGTRESTAVGQQVIVASGENYPDALAGAALGGAHWAPVLLTGRDRVSQATLDEIARIKTNEILVLGGVNSVSDAVVAKLGTVATTRRIGGSDRYAVAAALLPEFGSSSGTVYIASGENYPDALSASAAAIQEYAPVFLVAKNYIPDATKKVLNTLKPLRIIVLGGPNTISDSVVAELNGYLRP